MLITESPIFRFDAYRTWKEASCAEVGVTKAMFAGKGWLLEANAFEVKEITFPAMAVIVAPVPFWATIPTASWEASVTVAVNGAAVVKATTLTIGTGADQPATVAHATTAQNIPILDNISGFTSPLPHLNIRRQQPQFSKVTSQNRILFPDYDPVVLACGLIEPFV